MVLAGGAPPGEAAGTWRVLSHPTATSRNQLITRLQWVVCEHSLHSTPLPPTNLSS